MTAPWLDGPQKPRGVRSKPRKADPVTEEVRAIVRARSGGVCELCGEAPVQHFHHRQLRRSGDHTPRNIVGLCNLDHQRVHGHVRWALDTGWVVSQYDDPALREVLYRGRDWLWLGVDGSMQHRPPTTEVPC